MSVLGTLLAFKLLTPASFATAAYRKRK